MIYTVFINFYLCPITNLFGRVLKVISVLRSSTVQHKWIYLIHNLIAPTTM